jgi:SAM-dependent methyltransferase
MELLVGAGASRIKKIATPDNPDWKELVTLDMDDRHKPDVLHDLTKLPLPFRDDTFDEIHAYEVLEHTGQQGDWRFFLDQWAEFWRIMKPNGWFCGTSPMPNSPWAWGDPGHTRIISKESFIFLNQPQYKVQVGVTPMTDYRFCFKADFEPVHIEEKGNTFIYVLQAIKPSRYYEKKRKAKGSHDRHAEPRRQGVV